MSLALIARYPSKSSAPIVITMGVPRKTTAPRFLKALRATSRYQRFMRMADRIRRADQVYQQRSAYFRELRDRCMTQSRWLMHARAIAFVGFAASALWASERGLPSGLPWLALALALLAAFFALIILHNEVSQRCDWHDRRSKLNDEGLARLARDWEALPEADTAAADPGHPFAEDLDVFGRASLFSLLGTVATPPGRHTLRSWLLEPATPPTVGERQAAVTELATLVDIREEITLRGRTIPQLSEAKIEKFLAWAESDPWLSSRFHVVWMARLLPLVTLALIALNIAGRVPYVAWMASIVVNLAFTFHFAKRIHSTFDRAFARESAFQAYAGIFRTLSTTPFEAPTLVRLQRMMTSDEISAHEQMKRLHGLEGLAAVRYAMLHGVIQALTLWDFHVLVRVERWQSRAGRYARRWLAALGEADALAALAGLRFDHSDWVFAQMIEDGAPVVEATDLGHPLLRDDVRIDNDVKLGPPGRFLFVTGSNMSGKSTLLRAIGTNVVLAGAGAPVCASSMRLPPLRLATSMRVHDSLQQGLSQFMAELQRLKGVVEAAREVERDGKATLLYLLDDIFQGTNTEERRIAARKVVTRLLAAQTIGAVTSHDLNLADTPVLSAARVAVHFSETIEQGADGPKISFDYKLRPGIATSRNALKLLEIVGLDEGTPNAPDTSTE
jgi:ABC-type multidrug transport system fused ATPase/permease subunit